MTESLPPVDAILHLLDELATLIQQVERASIGGTLALVRDQVRIHEAATYQLMERLGATINAFLATQPPADLTEQIYALVTTRVRAWSRTSPVFHHIFSTPRQKLDSYEVTELLLDNRPGGADVPGQMLNHYYLNMTTSAAFRLRNAVLARRLAAEVKRRALEHRPVRLLNLHTGLGSELELLLRDRTLRPLVHVTCLDTDAAALRRAKQTLAVSLDGRVRFQFGDPRHLVASQAWPDAPYDLIYALILFDQLSDRGIEPLIAGCCRGLRPGGMLIFGNFADSMPDSEHVLIDWLMAWNVRRRSEETLRRIFARTPFAAQAVSYELDPFDASWLVIAERTSS